jgi:hypothetical protein
MATTQTFQTRITKPTEQQLENGLILRSPRDDRDIDRCAAFVSATVREISGITTERILRHFPTMKLDDFLFVEDERSGEVVSTTCLIPWECRFDQVVLNVAMLEVVATHPAYRKRGLIRTQIAAFHKAVATQGFDLSIIEGIPYYYRQFGYAYAVDHSVGEGLPSGRIPDLPHITPVRLRVATLDDIPHLARFYDTTFTTQDISTLRTEALWRYLLTAGERPLYMIEENGNGSVAGYLCAWRQPNGDISISESGIPSAETALALLHLCKEATTGEIVTLWPRESTLAQVSRSLGSSRIPSHQWLLRITHPQNLLAKLAPLFEERLAESASAGFSGDLIINLFRQAYQMSFAEGHLLKVDSLGFVDASMGADGGDLCIPPDAFVRLLLGYRTLAQLPDAWPDIVIRSSRRHLLDTLFPQCRSCFSMPYFNFGHVQRVW